jgi:hypothetical protein
MICCFFSSFKTFAMLREATNPPAAVNVLDVSSESMAAFQVFMYGRFWVFTEGIEEHREAEHSRNNSNGLERLRQQQWLALAENLCSLANLHRESHNYLVAHALYGRALAAAERVVALGDDGRSLIERIRTSQQAVSETLQVGDTCVEQAPSEELQIAGR